MWRSFRTLRPHLLAYEPLIGALLLFLFLDWEVHRFSALRNALDFRPEVVGSDINDYFTANVMHFARMLQAIPFSKSLYLINPWSELYFEAGQPKIQALSSHPGLVSGFSSLLAEIFGFKVIVFRRIGIFLFCFRFFAFWTVARMAGGATIGRLAALLHLLAPATHLLFHPILLEPAAITFVLLSFWALEKKPALAIPFYSVALLTDWTALFSAPVLAFFLYRKKKRVLSALSLLISVFLPALYYHYFHWLGGSEPRNQVSLPLGPVLENLVGRLLDYAHPLLSGEILGLEYRKALFQRFYLNLPILYLLPAIYGIWKTRKLASWHFALLGLGVGILLFFSGGIIVHDYMALPFSLFGAYFGAVGWLEFYKWARRSRLIQPLFVIAIVLGSYEAYAQKRFPFFSKETAGEVGLFAEESRIVGRLTNRKKVLLVKDFSQWEPLTLTTYSPGTFFVFEMEQLKNEPGGCADYFLVYNQIFQEKYGHMAIMPESLEILNTTRACQEEVFRGHFFKLLSVSCNCGAGK